MQDQDIELLKTLFTTAAYNMKLLTKQAPTTDSHWSLAETELYNQKLKVAQTNYRLLGKLIIVNTQFELPF